jgi:hypothetical protein
MSILKCLSRMTAELSYQTLYTCVKCGDESVGTPVHKTLRVNGPEQLIAAIRDIPQRAADMPFEWAYHEDGYRCPACKNLRKKKS